MYKCISSSTFAFIILALFRSQKSIIRVAESVTMEIQSLLERDRRGNRRQVDLKVQSNILSTIVERDNRTTNLIQALLKVDILPLSEDTIEVAVVQLEQWVSGRVVCISDRA